MKKVQLASGAALGLSAILWTAGRIFLLLPDWAVRLNGVIMLIAMAALVFSSVRLKIS